MQPLPKTHDRQHPEQSNFYPKSPIVQFEITRGRARETIRQIDGSTFFIGSGAECDLVLGGDQFPELHSYLLINAQGVEIRHLGMPPNLFVDGRACRRAVLGDQARIGCGPFEFTIHILSRSLSSAGLPERGDGTATCATAPGSRRMLEDVESCLQAVSSKSARDLPRLKLHTAGPSQAIAGTPSLPVSIGLVAPSVKPPAWRHIAYQSPARAGRKGLPQR